MRVTKKILIVFDTDARNKVNKENYVDTELIHIIFLKKTQNSIATKGIENLFPESLFNYFADTNTKVDGSTGKSTQNKKFKDNMKSQFLTHILSQTDESIWDNFDSFVDDVRVFLNN